jgi:hypothetical protein
MISISHYKLHLESRVDEITEKIFQGALRLYYPIDLGEVLIDNETYIKIDEVISSDGGEIVDYVKGLFKDEYGRICKIGKYLTKSKKDYLLKEFINDNNRTLKNINTEKKYLICISRHIEDICYMTTGRRWADKSCMSFNDRPDFFLEEIKNQTLVVYLIDEDDLEIKNPYSRMLIKKHFLMGEDTPTWIYYPSPIVYGLDNDIFRKFVLGWVNKIQKVKNGVYSLHSELEGVGYPLIHIFDKLTESDIRYIIDELDIFEIIDGYYTIDENLEISVFAKNSNLKNSIYKSGSVVLTEIYTKLPFKFKKVDGDFIISDNFLTTLENCPEYVGGDFNCSENRFSSLQYCPQSVGGIFDCSTNSKISSLNYLPETLDILNVQYCYIKTLENNSTLKKINIIDLSYNELTTLQGFPSVSKSINISGNKLTSLDGIPTKRFYDFDISHNPPKLYEKYTQVQIRELYKIRGVLTYRN